MELLKLKKQGEKDTVVLQPKPLQRSSGQLWLVCASRGNKAKSTSVITLQIALVEGIAAPVVVGKRGWGDTVKNRNKNQEAWLW